ncbi:MAG: DUF885 domain-containing protein [Acidimicrobiia bacterium]
MTAEPGPIERYLALGLRAGRLLDGLVDAYYGPEPLISQVDSEPAPTPAQVAEDARRLVADLDAGVDEAPGRPPLDPRRRRYLKAQVLGVATTARRLAGEPIPFEDEVEQCYGVRPTRVPEEEIAAAHRRVDTALGGSGPLAERLIAWREAQAVDPDVLEGAVRDIAEEFRERTSYLFGLPDGEHVDFELVSGQPWSGFNYYLGSLRSRVAINTDLPVLAPSLGHLVAHEAYPGHHTEHSRKEAGLVRRQGFHEEAILLVGTPQATLAEGLADLGFSVIVPSGRHELVAEILRPLGIHYDAEVATAVEEASEVVGNGVRGNIAFLLHVDGAGPDEAVAYGERWGLLPRNRAEKTVAFQTDPTWRSYIFCYIDGLRLCRGFVGDDPARFERLITEQLVPADLSA